MRILIADDDRVSQRILAKHLAKLGHEVLAVGDGAAALEQLKKELVDIAIIDWMMPGLDGPEVCRTLRSGHADRYVYLILLTAKDSSSDLVTGLESGADDYLTKPVNVPELEARLRSGQRIIQLQENLISAREKLRAQATRDALTGLLNRGALFENVRRELRSASRERGRFAILLCDVDHFKKVNDTYGHPAGDEVLREVASRLSGSLRSSDWVGRYGGEEFMIALPQAAPPQVGEVAERVRKSVCASPIQISTTALPVSISIGAAVSEPEQPREFEELIEMADMSLLQAKRRGRNRVVFHGTGTQEPAPQPSEDRER